MTRKALTLGLTIAILLVIVSCGGKGGNPVSADRGTSLYASCFTLEQVASSYFPDPTYPLELIVTETQDEVLVTLQSRYDTSLAELLYVLRYDSNQLSPTGVEMGMCLGDEERALHTSCAEIPGRIGIAEVMFGLEYAEIGARRGVCCCRVLEGTV